MEQDFLWTLPSSLASCHSAIMPYLQIIRASSGPCHPTFTTYWTVCFVRKLKLYEEQELTMQVFCEPENTGLTATPPQPAMERAESADFCQVMHAKSCSVWWRKLFWSWSGRPARPRPTALLPPHSNGKTKDHYCSCWAPDDGHEDARNMLSCTLTSGNKLEKLLHLVGWFIWTVWWCTDWQTLKKKKYQDIVIFLNKHQWH
jgi:hypothetical protein